MTIDNFPAIESQDRLARPHYFESVALLSDCKYN
jgi:hypothetical protein